MSISSVNSELLRVKPQIDLNLATEANRILYVINKIISRAKMAGLLKTFVKDEGHVLKDIVDPNAHFYILQSCDKYHYSVFNRIHSPINSTALSTISRSTTKSSKRSMRLDGRIDDPDDDDDTVSIYSSASLSKSERVEAKLRDRNDPALSKVIFMLEENAEVRKLVQEMENEISPQMMFFIRTLVEFRDLLEVRFRENATQSKIKERYLRETYEKNERAKKEIEKLEEELVFSKTDANVCLIGKNILINRHQNKIEKIQQNSLEVIEKKVRESENAMVNDWKNSCVIQEKLKSDLEQTSEKYSNLLKDHLAAEKILRAKRTKVENQVLGWIQKFDQDIGEKQAEEEEIQELLDKETKEVNEIQAKLDEQEEEYDELMQEKAEYEEEMLERRLYQFIVNRSARRIQRTFRLYKARKLAKKLAKKGKKAKKKGKKSPRSPRGKK